MQAWEFSDADAVLSVFGCVHIHCFGNGCLGFRSYSGSLLKSAKVSKTLLPHPAKAV
ncbi:MULTISPECIES: hypothetical protein [Pseudomonas]|uniref:hypothetical protein n=1 Tax=Pseudomonas TaxID=286 RepID=UPI001AE26B6F|nr:MULTISPECIES: hypothetical protein [unclassified Pseudomonas]MBP1127416.1 hypothetical protein [Pseudomonas sp. PvP025]MDQ0401276.1 hypothetical protein [Pseudomonas sp. PvP006]